ncbi:MAG: geranylgeranylglyceryl/heptaprenylglyceryl phosphate synthase [Bacteroidales bacterium]|jgi:putative glycerol-1-phosphate prenyltransferase|nr:geranylgeranylglyceryl/heptaprenylglyceryl phosphate synthase [Bacteroidales bacterium]
MSGLYTYIQQQKAQQKHSLAVLIDPDKVANLERTIATISKSRADLIFVGGSLVSADTSEVVAQIKKKTTLPIVLFPGNASQVVGNADALLLLSLISGRNAEFLIGQHVNAAVQIAKTNLEVIPTGYILIDGGVATSVQYMSATQPIPANKVDIATATALAGELLGLKMVYLEAGSGARNPVSSEIISSVRDTLRIPIIVGGGLRSVAEVERVWNAGADIAVVGTAIEKGEFQI